MAETERMPTIEEIRQALVGQQFETVKADLGAKGWSVRQQSIDGKAMFGTADVRQDRINVRVSGGVITEVTGIG